MNAVAPQQITMIFPMERGEEHILRHFAVTTF